MKPYRLLLVLYERKPDTPAGIHCSNQMIGWGLWTEFSKMRHVTLGYQLAEPQNGDVAGWEAGLEAMPGQDFILIHSYTPGSIFNKMELLHKKARQVLWTSENSFAWMDRCFTYLPPEQCLHPSSCEQVPLPCLKDVIEESRRGSPGKAHGSVLLDHAYNVPDKGWLWCDRLYQWLEPLRGTRMIGQMESPGHEALAGVRIPDWVRRVPNSFYLDYLRDTAPYENYVMTHPGSYEHSIVDMVARGTRVLVPTMQGRTFAPRDTVGRLGLPVFSNGEELLEQLDVPHDGRDEKLGLCTGMPEYAAQIDAWCQGALP